LAAASASAILPPISALEFLPFFSTRKAMSLPLGLAGISGTSGRRDTDADDKRLLLLKMTVGARKSQSTPPAHDYFFCGGCSSICFSFFSSIIFFCSKFQSFEMPIGITGWIFKTS
jgi:hypothetical protein